MMQKNNIKKALIAFTISLSSIHGLYADVAVKAYSSNRFCATAFDIDFDAAMNFHNSDPFNKKNHPIINFARRVYTNNHPTCTEPSEKPLIPKIIHLIWLGPKKPPAITATCLKSIKEYLPDWEVKLWRDDDVPPLKLVNKKYYDEETNFAAKSDILRYELLYRFGGVYIDVDIELIKCLDAFNHRYDFYAGLEASDSEAFVGNSIIASAPGHPILKCAIDQIKDHRTELVDWKVVERTGPKHFQQAVFEGGKICDQSKVMVFPKSFFYPINFSKRHAKDFSDLIKQETCCIHYWAGSWIADEEKV